MQYNNVGLESDDTALIAILSGIAGSAAAFLFSSASGGEVGMKICVKRQF